MKNIITAISNRQTLLKTITASSERRLSKSPDGKLRVLTKNKAFQYYHVSKPKDYNGVYLNKKKRTTAAKLAQKEYDQKVIQAAKEENKLLQQLYDFYHVNPVDELHLSLHPGKQRLIKPVVTPDEDYINNWINQDYRTNTFHPEERKYENNRGIMMRSKSEVIISEILDSMNIPYIYEKELPLDYLHSYFPDFTILDVKNRREVYLEHLGMMDDPDYISSALQKIKKYEENGYRLNDNLLLTYETLMMPLNTTLVKEKLSEFAR
ncbi:hypothetical protein SAMN02910298_02903 [Pseudobutyrivibrio sp. YE44]|uniref:hypothetical protein n=1 Tax=Pseudobutyrivibrio sp. YE44 TaxID=1520802 RepID=UPI00087E0A5F|nr:hypothetical protein [Pseudobutyrivibrio sp. YE44]SDB56215.1 hypothetical protein SAMN02910298_02903 [Pseudobutyrivibrio sp. YE44]